LISLNLLKLGSAVLGIAVIGKLSLEWPQVPFYGIRTVAYLGFPAPGDKFSFGAPTQPVHASIDAKNEFVIKGRRKLTRDL